MSAKSLELHPEALEELISAVSWYMQRSESAALKFAAEVDKAMELVAESPKRWPAGSHDTRKFVLQHFPFAVIYREKGTKVQILAIAHGHRRPGYWKQRT